MKHSFSLFSIILLLFYSCSNDGASDRIIGNWEVVEIYSNGKPAQLGCSDYSYFIVKEDYTTTGDFKDEKEIPEQCKSTNFTVSKWRKIGNEYELFNPDNNEVQYILYFKNEFLIVENLSKTIQWYYLPY